MNAPPGEIPGAAHPLSKVRRSRATAIVAFAVGLLLMAAALWAVLRDPETLRNGLSTLRSAPWPLVAGVLGLYMANFVCAAASFWVLVNRYGRVRYGEMLALIAAATVFNFLPLRPGMVGRVAYHRTVNGIPVRDSLKVLMTGLFCAGAAVASLVAAAWAAHLLSLSPGRSVAVMTVPFLAAVAATLALRRATDNHWWRWSAAAAFRYLDVAIWAARYALIFAILGRPLAPSSAAAVAFSSQLVMISPVQLGLREWVVGVTAGAIAATQDGARGVIPRSVSNLAPGLLADLVNRSAEFMVAIPAALVAVTVLYRRFRLVRRAIREPIADAVNPPDPSTL